MWTALMLLCLSSLPLSGGRVASSEPRHLVPVRTWHTLVKRNASVDSGPRVEVSEETTAVTPPLVTVSSQTLPARLNFTHALPGAANGTNASVTHSLPGAASGTNASVTHSLPGAASGTNASVTHTLPGAANGTNASVPAAAGRTAGAVASSAPSPTFPRATASGPASSRRAPAVTATATGPPPPSTRHAQVPSTTASVPTAPSPRAATAQTRGAPGPPGPAAPTSTHSTASPAPPTGPQAQGPTTLVVTLQPVLTMAERTPPWPPSRHLGAQHPHPRGDPSDLSRGDTTQARAREPPASTAPAPHTSPAPTTEAITPTTPPRPTPSGSGPGGPSAAQTPGQGETRATPGTGPTPLNSGDQRLPATDSCQPSTHVPHLLVTPKPLAPFLVNRTSLLVVLILGVALFVTVVVVFALQAYESYKKKDYTQVDYLINGMYADSEM
ncbi:LOW QUALITY PROTEIN: uncharacterized protein C11orf24 homolog [Perognathus longimembris pacificus]|uniref:LOW QUALITY PROTEIN: uncharacterized protein C11orf24 homolog n=1 Tax=Perognathus longimembris pacificus TaxID=214514 RepID=UPI00201908AC|nr:LOW QUALITY PROTEIN: uncharacterized protein C11orf24 homolog [Perognathus longimembris pacificus]